MIGVIYCNIDVFEWCKKEKNMMPMRTHIEVNKNNFEIYRALWLLLLLILYLFVRIGISLLYYTIYT